MSLEVQPYLTDSGGGGNFTEDAPRPPVPGEENDSTCNSGNSTRSYGSLKSRGSSRGSTKQKEIIHSPAATPRQSNLKGCTHGAYGDDEAPLGFEPEGSVSNSPPFTESSTPSYLKWAENMNFLLEDSEGVKLFKEFLAQDSCATPLDFWFACQGFKNNVPASDAQKIYQLIKIIYKNYIKGDGGINIQPETKRVIVEKVTKKDHLDQTIFDDAQVEVETTMRNSLYPSFLKSDNYVQYVQTGGESPKTSTTNSSNSGSNSARPTSGILPTVHEDSELQHEDITASKVTAPLTSRTLHATRFMRAELSPRKPDVLLPGTYGSGSGRVPNPYHVSYAPVSAQDSELQSLSSDALTDETMSLTDSSVDGSSVHHNSKKWKAHQRRAMKRSVQHNRDTALNQNIIPRTDRAPKDRNIAEVDPIAFAAMLTERLEKVLKEQASIEKIRRLIVEPDTSASMDETKSSITPYNKSAASATLTSLMAAAEKDREDNAQSILEEHVSRIWDCSNGQTPSRSPGKHSPKSKSPERAYRKLLTPGYMAGVPKPGYHASSSSKRKDKDYISLHSYDSGVSEPSGAIYDIAEPTTHYKHIHHHHHHHHAVRDVIKSSKQLYEVDAAQQCGISCCVDDAGNANLRTCPPDSLSIPGYRDRSRESGKRVGSSKKVSDSSSNVYDSGVSVAYDRSPPLPVPNMLNPNNEKVLNWMLENEKVKECTTGPTELSDRSSSHKRSYKSSTASPSQHRQGTSKKTSQYPNTRSGSQERSGLQPQWIGPDGAPLHHKKPSQPIVQDPSMPLLTPPNPITQLEEAKRRLEASKMPKSRSFTGATAKDKRAVTATYGTPPRQHTGKTTTTTTIIPEVEPYSVDSSQSSTSGRLEKSQRMMSPANTPGTPGSHTEKTVIGYYMCGDPIPYRSVLDGANITLRQFKQLITKKGNYKFFFKRASDEFDTGVVHEEITDDNAVLPLWEGKIVGKVEKIES
ncbi:axin-1-like [Tubulanus polymorphus]|uniref:axin-1-like n=1 Tax=Tubulanus polymorphus TaxID=672921 RepID=UPI003DA63AE6